jgi:hypothetical protein
MEAVRTSEMSVHSNETTLRYIPEDSKLLSHLLSKRFFEINTGILNQVTA